MLKSYAMSFFALFGPNKPKKNEEHLPPDPKTYMKFCISEKPYRNWPVSREVIESIFFSSHRDYRELMDNEIKLMLENRDCMPGFARNSTYYTNLNDARKITLVPGIGPHIYILISPFTEEEIKVLSKAGHFSIAFHEIIDSISLRCIQAYQELDRETKLPIDKKSYKHTANPFFDYDKAKEILYPQVLEAPVVLQSLPDRQEEERCTFC